MRMKKNNFTVVRAPVPAVEHEAEDLVRRRKADHLKLFRRGEVRARQVSTWLEHVHLVHQAFCSISLNEISLETEFCGRRFSLPLFITGMTGGTDLAGRINNDLASVAERLGLGFGLGSCRALLEDPRRISSYQVRKRAPRVFLAANLGVVQLCHASIDRVREMMERLEADALCVHLNPAQELLQPEGDRDFRGLELGVRRAVEELGWPVIVKETGAGISRESARKLKSAGVKAVDVAGCGGTSWVGVEALRTGRGQDPFVQSLWDWGIPTAASLLELKGLGLELMASGGIRSGLDAARALSLGAVIVGLAAPVLRAWYNGGAQGAERFLATLAEELRAVMLLCGCSSIDRLHRVRKVIDGPLLVWQRSLARSRQRSCG
jgi:isopentenyl-diphosphate delta-isomerase